ncbi:MAG: hypothetical protein QOI55_2553, partial [Actinomycetota bacterium]|nr:hypothetical protein [Actinomycetota bacterium]
MPNPRAGASARPPARRPGRRPEPRTILRRRVFAIVMLAVAVLLVYTVWPKPSGHGAVSVSNHAAPAPGASRASPVVHVTAAAAGWRLGSPLSRAVAFSDGGSILAAGGLDSAQNTVSAVQRIDPGSGATTASGSLTVPVHDAAGATIDAKHFVFGGGAQHVSDVVQVLEPNGPSTVVGHLPQPRADLAAATIGSTAYLVGGYDGTNATRDVLATSDGAVFRTVAQLPFGVRYPAVAALGNQVYVFGGELGGAESDAVQQIDVRTGTARVVAQLPSPRTE